MVAHLFTALIIIALASLLITQGKRRRVWSILLLIALGIITYFFLNSLSAQPSSGFIYQWLPYRQLRADFNISSSLRMQSLLQPLICLLGALILLNIINLKENYSLQISTLNLLSFTLLILLASSHDFFQLMFAAAALSIICFYIPVSLNARRHFFIYNFLAEFATFVALAITYGSIDTISLSSLTDFAAKGTHKDFVCTLLIFSLWCKTGMFMFNGHYHSLSDESFNRLSGLYLSTQPLAGLIIAAKLHPIFFSAPWSIKIFTIWCSITALQGGFLLIFRNSFNLKIIGILQAAFSGMLYLVYRQPEILYSLVAQILLLLLIVILSLYFTIGLTRNISRYPNVIGFLTGCFVLPTIGIVLHQDQTIIPNYWGIISAAVYGSALRISCSPAVISAIKPEELPRGWVLFYNLVIIILCTLLITNTDFRFTNDEIICVGAFLIALAITPPKLILRIGNQKIWQYDFAEMLYRIILLTPLRFFGRLLWLTFDFIFIERGIIASLSSYGQKFLCRLHATQINRFINWFIYFIIGIALLILYILGADNL